MKLRRIVSMFLCIAALLSLTACLPKSDVTIAENDDVTIAPRGEVGPNGGTFILKNNTEQEMHFGRNYSIEVLKNGEWRERYAPADVTAEAVILEAGGETLLTESWSDTLAAGTYRFVKEIGGVYYACQFKVTEFKAK